LARCSAGTLLMLLLGPPCWSPGGDWPGASRPLEPSLLISAGHAGPGGRRHTARLALPPRPLTPAITAQCRTHCCRPPCGPGGVAERCRLQGRCPGRIVVSGGGRGRLGLAAGPGADASQRAGAATGGATHAVRSAQALSPSAMAPATAEQLRRRSRAAAHPPPGRRRHDRLAGWLRMQFWRASDRQRTRRLLPPLRADARAGHRAARRSEARIKTASYCRTAPGWS